MTSVSDLLFEFPLVIFKFVQFISLPVNCYYWFIERIPNSRYLKWKDGILKFIIGLSYFIATCVVEESLIWKFTMKPSHDYYFVAIYLANTLPLSGLKQSYILDI